ncbi:hypothetical protein PAHAL_9G157900 [Panicum hallii]|jgi:hypothetical protein|uniref:Uncharacterized protein n=1 Tax=Panicum hallii TaxID=206008 RepID=A0A2S3IJW3_9POAL|nr:alanine and glycine-rich protein-like [Panicum hallii]PAN46015.1 hypothetical protein PAHAL_9G157900 [Panicum hallii]
MDRASARRIAVAAALHLLAALHGAGPCAAAARPLVGRLPAAASRAATSALAVAPTAAHQRRAGVGGDAAAREGKWLPFAGAHHLPAAYWAHKPVPSWVGLGAGAGELGGGAAGAAEGAEGEEEEAVRDGERRRRQRPSYAGDGASTRQEQLAMWASLLNPKRRGAPATGWLPGPGIGEAADDEPAKQALDTAVVEGAEGDEPSAGQSFWGNNGN